jgi:hypothetical protein
MFLLSWDYKLFPPLHTRKRQSLTHSNFYELGSGKTYTGPYAANGTQVVYWLSAKALEDGHGCCVYLEGVGTPPPDWMQQAKFSGHEQIRDPRRNSSDTIDALVWNQAGSSDTNYYWADAKTKEVLQFGARINRTTGIAHGGFFQVISPLQPGEQQETELKPPSQCNAAVKC